jgi:hypothetical protein
MKLGRIHNLFAQNLIASDTDDLCTMRLRCAAAHTSRSGGCAAQILDLRQFISREIDHLVRSAHSILGWLFDDANGMRNRRSQGYGLQQERKRHAA